MIIKISETGEAPPTKIGLHACYINLYLHDYFELILFLTPPPWTIKAKSVPINKNMQNFVPSKLTP